MASWLNTSTVGDLLCALAVCYGGNASCREEKTQRGDRVSSTGLMALPFIHCQITNCLEQAVVGIN